jgi:hypothetical protein
MAVVEGPRDLPKTADQLEALHAITAGASDERRSPPGGIMVSNVDECEARTLFRIDNAQLKVFTVKEPKQVLNNCECVPSSFWCRLIADDQVIH